MQRRGAGARGRGSATESSESRRPGADAPLDRVKRRIEREVGPDGYGRYFGGGERLELDGASLDVRVPDRFTANLIDRRFGPSLRRALAEELGQNQDVRVRCRVDRRQRDAAPQLQPAPDRRPPRPPTPPTDTTAPGREPHDEPQTLDNFIVGEANRVAHAACVQVCTGGAVRVLFLHGSCGVGKTHLLRGVADLVRRSGAPGRVIYMTGEQFLNAFTASVRAGTPEKFQSRFKGAGVLCLDDVQTLSGNKTQTQRQLHLAIEQVLGGGGRVVLASDAHPGEMRAISRQLASRFVAGPVIRIDPPGADLRARLIKHRAAMRGLPISDEAVQLIADRAPGTLPGGLASVRDLEGVLIQIEAIWNLLPSGRASGASIDAGMAARALDLRSSRPTSTIEGARVERPAPLDLIARTVCRELGVEMGDLMGKGRHKRVVLARAMVVQVARKMTTRSYPEIARIMARRNHSTVITAHQRIRRQIDEGQRVDVGSSHDGLALSELGERLEREIRDAVARA